MSNLIRHRLRTIQGLLLVGLLVGLLASDTRADAFRDRYDEGIEMLQQGENLEAIRHFRGMLDDNRTSYLSDNCQYWIAEAYFRMDNYEQAVLEFDKVFTFRNNNKREDAFFRLGACYERMNDTQNAREIYTRFIAKYPESRHYQRVKRKLEAMGVE